MNRKNFFEDQTDWGYFYNYDEFQDKSEEDRMGGFVGLRGETTGLPVYIYVNQCCFYNPIEHPLWIYFQNDYEERNGYNQFLPMSVHDNPRVMCDKKIRLKSNDLEKIAKWITINKQELIDLSEEKISDTEFFNSIRNNYWILFENLSLKKLLLLEMPTLRPEFTGLNVPIWVDGERDIPHAPRIKFQAVVGTHSDSWSSMVIDDKKMQIENLPPKYDIDDNEIERVYKFVKVNKGPLLQLSQGKIDFENDFKAKIVKIGDNGQLIYPPKIENIYNHCKKIEDAGYGLTLVKSDDNMFNYSNKYDEIISPVWFSQANHFEETEYAISATAKIGNDWYWVLPNGRSIKIEEGKR
jgi:hypothetical protein